jgi:hypothetical protein
MNPLFLSMVVSVTSRVDARAPVPFYQGKTITVIVGYQAGDGYDNPESRRVFCHIVRGIRVKPHEL